MSQYNDAYVHPEVFCKKGVLKNFAEFTGIHMYQKLFLNKVAFLRPAALLKKRPWHRCFSVNFMKFLRTLFLRDCHWTRTKNHLVRKRTLNHSTQKHLVCIEYLWGANSNLCRLWKKALLIKKKRVTLGKLCFKLCYMK